MNRRQRRAADFKRLSEELSTQKVEVMRQLFEAHAEIERLRAKLDDIADVMDKYESDAYRIGLLEMVTKQWKKDRDD